MYNLHHSEGILLSTSDFGEADRVYAIFTKGFGKIEARAIGVRLEKSKLRGHLNLFSLVRLSFIEGKEQLRLTDAEELIRPALHENNFYHFGRMSALIERLIRGQEKDEGLWQLIFSAWQYMSSAQAASDTFDLLFEARLLHRLGYVSPDQGEGQEMITGNHWLDISYQPQEAEQLKKICHEGLIASQL